MESVERERLKTRKELEKDHPLLGRKFSSMDEYSKAKLEYIMKDKPATFWADVAKAVEEVRNKEKI